MTETHTIDAFLSAANNVTHSVDALLIQSIEKTHTIDSLLESEFVSSHTIDALLEGALLKTHTVDALLQDTLTDSHTLDALLTQASSHTIDAFLEGALTSSHTIDAKLFKKGYPEPSGPIDEFLPLEGVLSVSATLTNLCWESLVDAWDFVEALVSGTVVQFQVKKNNRLIIQGFETPENTESGIWANFDANRNPVGWFGALSGGWERFYTPIPGEVIWITGDSNKPPVGWQPILPGLSDIDPAIFAKLQEKYVKISSSRYSYFAVKYIGY